MNKNGTQGGGIGVMGLIGIVFVTLKLTGVIDWSWWWVTLPFWGGLALAIVVVVIVAIIAAIAAALEPDGMKRKRRRK